MLKMNAKICVSADTMGCADTVGWISDDDAKTQMILVCIHKRINVIENMYCRFQLFKLSVIY